MTVIEAVEYAKRTLERIALSIGTSTTAENERSWRNAADMAMRAIEWALAHSAPHPAVAVPGSLTDEQRQALIDMLNEQHMTAVYHCLRVWEAWSVGTMSEDDFQPASESEMAAEIVDAILSAIATTSTAAQPGDAS